MSDSRVATHEHIKQVQWFLAQIIRDLLDRSLVHDQSKLRPPEVELFDEYTDKLADTTYGSPEYQEYLEKIRPALEHHYARNRHHPEHFPGGVGDMNLLDVIEMIADWKAASLRHHDGNILKSIQHNQQRFGYGDDVKRLLVNTVNYLGY